MNHRSKRHHTKARNFFNPSAVFTPLNRADLSVGQYIVCISRTAVHQTNTITIEQGTVTHIGDKITLKDYSRFYREIKGQNRYLSEQYLDEWSISIRGSIYLVESRMGQLPPELTGSISNFAPDEIKKTIVDEALKQNLP